MQALDGFSQISHWLVSANVTHFPTTFAVGDSGHMAAEKVWELRHNTNIRFAKASTKQRDRLVCWMVRCADASAFGFSWLPVSSPLLFSYSGWPLRM